MLLKVILIRGVGFPKVVQVPQLHRSCSTADLLPPPEEQKKQQKQRTFNQEKQQKQREFGGMCGMARGGQREMGNTKGN